MRLEIGDWRRDAGRLVLRRSFFVILVLALGLRLLLIFPGPFESKVEFLTNKADLRNYYWPSQAALRGENPYALWASGQSGEFRSDMAPLELALYVATVALWNDPRAIQVLFAVCDTINIALLGVLFTQSPLRLPFQLFYAFGPLTLYNFVLVPQDKTIVLTLTFLLFWLLSKYDSVRITRYALLAIIAAALIASFKWLSVFYLLPLVLFLSKDVRDFLRYGLVFAAIVALAHAPWFPDWSYVYAFRSARIAWPSHTSLAALLNTIGWYDKNVMLALLVLVLLTVYALFWLKRIDIFETMALAVAAGVLWTPDMDPVHLSVVVIYLLLIVNWRRGVRPWLVWGLSLLVAAVYAISTRSGYTRYGLPDLASLTGAYGSARMIVMSSLLFIVVFGFYVRDKFGSLPIGMQLLRSESE